MERPNKKVGAGALAGALAIVLIWVISLFGVEVPGAVGAAIATIFGFITAYYVPEPTK